MIKFLVGFKNDDSSITAFIINLKKYGVLSDLTNLSLLDVIKKAMVFLPPSREIFEFTDHKKIIFNNQNEMVDAIGNKEYDAFFIKISDFWLFCDGKELTHINNKGIHFYGNSTNN